jgi:hypothetical protein
MNVADLQKFCADERDAQYHLHRPFSRREWTWATNGKLMLRVPRIEEVAEDAAAPDVVHVFEQYRDDAQMRPPKFNRLPDPSDLVECNVCHGRGTLHDCPDCQCECGNCDDGMVEENQSVSVAGLPFDARYVRLLLTLPGLLVEIYPISDRPMSFRFDGGCGLVNPLRCRWQNHLDLEL